MYAKVACFGFHSGTNLYRQSTGSRKNFTFSHQLEGDNGGSVGPAYSSGIPYSFQCRSLPNAPSSTLPVFEHCQYLKDQMNLVHEEVMSLVRKGAVVIVESSTLEKGFYLTIFFKTLQIIEPSALLLQSEPSVCFN